MGFRSRLKCPGRSFLSELTKDRGFKAFRTAPPTGYLPEPIELGNQKFFLP